MMLLFGAVIGVTMTLIVYGAYMILIAFTLWMVVDAGKQDRFWWVFFIIGVPIIGSAAYYYTEKKHEYGKVESHHIHITETEEQHERAPKKVTRARKSVPKTVETSATEEQRAPEAHVEHEEKQEVESAVVQQAS